MEERKQKMIDYTQGSGKQYHIGLAPEETAKYVILTGGRSSKTPAG